MIPPTLISKIAEDIDTQKFQSLEHLRQYIEWYALQLKETLIADYSFLRDNPESLEKNLISYYTFLSLFPDETTFEIFKKLGMSDNGLKWFIPFGDFIKHFDTIEKTPGFCIDRLLAFSFILTYLNQKIIYQCSLEFSGLYKYRGKDKPLGYIEIRRFYDKVDSIVWKIR